MVPALLAGRILLAAFGAFQTPRQREIVTTIRTRAVAASVAASEALIVELDQPEFKSALAQRGLPELARQSGRALLERLRAEAASAEIVHNLAIWANETSDSACNAVANPGGSACPSCLGWSVGNAQDMPRTPIFQQPQLDNLWELGIHGFVEPHHVVDWMSGPDTFEVGALGCDPFSGTLPSPSPWFNDGAVDFPQNISEANERPIYAVLDLKKVDVGIPDFGPVGIVFNRSKLAQDVLFMPADTGQWSYSCNLTNQGRKCQAHNDSRTCESSSRSCRWRNGVCASASDNCCVTNGGATGCQTCADTSACCTSDPSYNCSAWDVTPGVTGHLDHILLAAVRMWNDTTRSHTYTPASNLADLLGRSAAKDYFSERLTRLLPHNNYYVETNLLATPEFSSEAGDVLFVIGTFPWLFGHRRGWQLRQWASSLGFVLVWALGPERCYERINQTGADCDPGHWSPHLGSGEPAYIANGRVLDPKVSAGRTNISTDINAAGTSVFEEAWTDAVAQRARGSWDASAAWRALTNKLPTTLRLAPVSATRCGGQEELSMLGQSASGECVRVLGTI